MKNVFVCYITGDILMLSKLSQFVSSVHFLLKLC